MENNVRVENLYEASDETSTTADETVESSEEVKSEEVVEDKVAEGSKPEEVKAEPKIDLSSRFARLSKKEKELRDLESNIKAKQIEIDKWNEIKTKAKSDPASVLGGLGLTLEELLVGIAGEDKPPVKELTEMEILRNEINELKKSKEDEKAAIELESKAKEEQQLKDKQAQHEKVISDFKVEIKQVIEKESEKFEIVNSQNAYDLVYDVIETHYSETQEVMPIDKAAGMVEEYLENQYKAVLNLNKFKRNAEVVKEDARELKEVKESVKTPKTLNNGMTNSSSTKQSSSKLTYEQRLAEAAKLLANS